MLTRHRSSKAKSKENPDTGSQITARVGEYVQLWDQRAVDGADESISRQSPPGV
jgi:hypothetical protein